MTAPAEEAAGSSPAAVVTPLAGEELFDDLPGMDHTRLIYVEGREKPYCVAPFPPRLLDKINKIQNAPKPLPTAPGQPLQFSDADDNEMWESRIVAAGICGPDKKRLNRSIEDVIAFAEQVADRMLPGTVKRLHREILAACKFGSVGGGTAEAIKKGSNPTPTAGTSSASPSNTAAGPSDSSTSSDGAGS